MIGRIGFLSKTARVLFGLYVGSAVLLLFADIWSYVTSGRFAGSKAYEIDADPPSRACSYVLMDQQRRTIGTDYVQVWKVACTYDRSKAYRPDDYPAYYYTLLADAPAASTSMTYLPLGALAARSLSKISATWKSDALHLSTWSGGLMDKSDRIGDVTIVFDLQAGG